MRYLKIKKPILYYQNTLCYWFGKFEQLDNLYLNMQKKKKHGDGQKYR